MIGKAIIALCTGYTVYPVEIPQELDFLAVRIAYEIISANPNDTKDGTAVTEYSVRFSMFCASHKTLTTTAISFKSAIDRLSGLYGGFKIDKVIFQNHYEMYDDEVEAHHFAQDYLIRVKP